MLHMVAVIWPKIRRRKPGKGSASLQVRRGPDDSCQAGNLSFSGGGGRGGIFPPCYPAMDLFNRDSAGLFILIKKMLLVGFDPWSAVPGFMCASSYVLLAYTQCQAILLTVLSSSVSALVYCLACAPPLCSQCCLS
jgi:hypothetical protein